MGIFYCFSIRNPLIKVHMLTIINFEKRQSSSGKEFFSLILQGGVEMVRSAETGQYYATIKRCSVTSTLDEEACKAMLGEQLEGKIEKVQCTPYEFVIPQTGEVVELSHRWSYVPSVETTMATAISTTTSYEDVLA
jgi:hypothetical protein